MVLYGLFYVDFSICFIKLSPDANEGWKVWFFRPTMSRTICRFYFSAPGNHYRQHFFGLPKKKSFVENSTWRRTDFNCFLNGFLKKRKKGETVSFFLCWFSSFCFYFCSIPNSLGGIKQQQRTQERRTEFLAPKATFLSWIFTSACIKWWHFYNQTRLAATITRKEQSHFQRDTSPKRCDF